MFKKKGISSGGIQITTTFSQIEVTHSTILTMMGQTIRVQSNHELITNTANQLYTPSGQPQNAPIGIVTLYLVEADEPVDEPNMTIHYSGHLLHISFSQNSFFTTDMATGYSTGRISTALASNYLKILLDIVITNLVQVQTPFVAVHAACLESNGRGILLDGPSGIGKSTLTFAAIEAGYGFVEDDTAMVNMTTGEIWNRQSQLRLLPDSVRFFPRLCDHKITRVENGEHKIIVDLEQLFPNQSKLKIKPGSYIFLERGAKLQIKPITIEEARSRFSVVWSWDIGWQDDFDAVLYSLIQNPYVLTIGDEKPHEIIAFLKKQKQI